MELAVTEYIGLIAGTLTTGAYLPQVWRTWRSKTVDDISLAMYWAMTLGVALWLVYGIAIRAAAVVIANAVCLVLVAGMLRMRIRYGRRAKEDAARGQLPPLQ